MLSTRVKWTVLAMVVVALVISASASFAQDYKGSKICIMCHKATHAAIVAGVDKTAHPKAFQDATANPAAVVATFDANAPIKKEDIKYVLGVGRRGQAYIGADMKTLPAEWSVTDKKWVTTSAQDSKTQCVSCHVTGYDAAKATWAEPGVTCEACHGPGSAHLADKTKIVNPKKLTPDKEAMVCGQCHSKGTDTTKAYAFPITYKPGGDLATAFIDAQPKTAGRNQQYSEWKTSKHAANNVVCTKCHEPHGANTTEGCQLVKPVVALCMGCHADKDMAKHAPSAPAGATCATCHMPQGRHTFAKPGA
jgi:predicted CXXCH cytochrome family protein